MSINRILFLDLDGTVRHSKIPGGFINDPDDIVVYPEASRLMKDFREAGWRLAYISNQGGIAAGFTTTEKFLAGVQKTETLLGQSFDDGAFCPHGVEDGCFCRKPRPGMVGKIISSLLSKAMCPHIVDLRLCLFVGDRSEDEGCANASGIPFLSAEKWRSGGYTLVLPNDNDEVTA